MSTPETVEALSARLRIDPAAPAWTYYARCDIAVVGKDPEEGTPIEGRAWYVVAENELTGERYRHDFVDAHRWHKETAVPRSVRRLLARIEASAPDPRGRAHWNSTYGRYGSRSWAGDQVEEVWREQQDARNGLD